MSVRDRAGVERMASRKQRTDTSAGRRIVVKPFLLCIKFSDRLRRRSCGRRRLRNAILYPIRPPQYWGSRQGRSSSPCWSSCVRSCGGPRWANRPAIQRLPSGPAVIAFGLESAAAGTENFCGPSEPGFGESTPSCLYVSLRISFQSATRSGARSSSILAWLTSVTMIWPTSVFTAEKRPCDFIFAAWYWLSSVGVT